MAPIKFEEDIRDKLEKRQLKPSSNAWKKLSDRLDEEPKMKTKTPFWWLGLAASFAGVLIVSSILFSKGSYTNIDTPALVEEETVKTVEEEAVLKNTVSEEDAIQESHIVLEDLDNEGKKEEKMVIEENTPVKLAVVEMTIDNSQELKESIIKENTIKEVDLEVTAVASNLKVAKSVEAQKVDEVVAQIQKLQEEKHAVTDAEIDALLHRAQKELTSKRLYNASKKTVDAGLLLLQVETDLDRSFRDRVFEALNSGYKKVRTAVAERNN